MKNGKVIFIII